MPICDPKHEGSSRKLHKRRRGASTGRFKFASPLSCMPSRLEGLEQRLLWSVSYDTNGWTVVTPSINTKIIYVSSSSGNDNNSGLSETAPVATFKKAESLLVSGQPDEILLKCGDTFNDAFLNWVYSGQDVNDPLLISYYNPNPGTPVVRPMIDSGTNPAGFATPINQPFNNAAVNYVDIIGLQFQANLKNPSASNFNASSAGGGTGFYFYNPGGNILLEDDSFEYYRYNMDIEGLEGAISNITVRRCVDDYAYGLSYSHSQGLYAYNVSNISVVQSVFDHDGWSSVVPTAEDLGFNHDMYIASTCSGVVIQNNVIAEAAFAGVMARAGGDIDNNLFIDNAISVAFGQANGADSTPGGVTGSLIGNVTVGDKTYDYGQAYGQGFDIGNIKPGAGLIVQNNIFTQDSQNAKPAIQLDPAAGTSNPTQAVGENNVTIENNITNGWRESIETDGRFADGVSPSVANLYAYNNVTVKNNDFINATTHEIAHPNAFDSATESWSDDSYYDSVLSQSSWITVANNAVQFSTWASSYDVGAKQLSSLSLFPDPNVTIASYDLIVGGPGTWQDFMTNADLMSIANYQPQYLALAAINYIQSGFGVPLTTSAGTTGSTTASGPPTASAATLNLNDSEIGTTTYSFTVNYIDSNALKIPSLGGGNLLITGPNGFSQYAAYVSSAPATTDANGYQHVSVTYLITAPNGAWAAGEDGTYTVTMLANQVYDSFGNAVPDGVIGNFSADFTPPGAIATVANINSSTQGSSSYSFTVSYADAAGIDTTTIDNYSVRITGPNSYSQYATVGNITSSGSSVTVTYTAPASGSSWASGTYTITLVAGTVSDLDGNTVTGGVLATFVAQAGSTNVTGTGSISGNVFDDANGDGVLDDRENTLTGVTIFIDLAGTGVYAAGDPQAVTDVNGNYTLSNLVAGRYAVLEQIPSGYAVTSPSTGSNVVTLTTGQAATDVNFANQLNTAVVSGTTSGSNSNSSSGTTTGSTTGSSTGNSGTGTNGSTGTDKSNTGNMGTFGGVVPPPSNWRIPVTPIYGPAEPSWFQPPKNSFSGFSR